MFELPVDRTPDRIDVLARWLPRVAVALAFVSLGSQKFTERMWVQIFDRIGFGDWFRYLTGVLQITGGVLVLIPRTCLIGLLLLACTMVGAMLAWVLVLDSPGSALVPGIALAILLAIATKQSGQE